MKPKDQPKTSLAELFKEHLESLGKLVDQRWWVEEYSPGGNYGYYDDVDYPEKVVQKSSYFKTRDEAEEYMAAVCPSWPENKLRVKGQNCYERLERRWI